MPIHNDLERAARDPWYRMWYENERADERLRRPLVPTRDDDKNKPKNQKPKKDEKSKVICTELHRQGLMSRDDYLLGLRFVREKLTPRHERGYHAWALSVVRTMRRSPRATRFWSRLASARADHIAFVYGDRSRKNRFGAMLCAVGHPTCFIIGCVVGEQDWRALYREEARENNSRPTAA